MGGWFHKGQTRRNLIEFSKVSWPQKLWDLNVETWDVFKPKGQTRGIRSPVEGERKSRWVKFPGGSTNNKLRKDQSSDDEV